MKIQTNQEAQLKRESLKSAYKTIFSSGDGKKILADLMRESGYKKELFGPNNETTNYNLGRRSLYIHILSMIGDEKDEL